ncbi:hypothetical protein PAHAL_3G153400 [Panicum hallii]|uniref:PWWP domain-containing protein n=1 Tax=Panicum hallii TaxID=206008 RepID=A0A2T8KIE5_9POAL|nr:uncharacterized protein LOC112887136 [Panicum hallii]PVH61909.1 hypothetical protein PAHAL_3G153400 [Panicum hallii]
MGALPKEEGASEAELSPAVDVSAEGTLVWLRRPNGSWWPSIVISPQDVPVGCAAPPRCAATPIMLLGRRRDGPTFVDWCNLDRCKRVKPFRCGEPDFEERITNALAATGNKTSWNYNKGRYARMEDAILQALDIERERKLEPRSKTYLHGGTCSPDPKIEMPNGQVKDAAARDPSTDIQPPPPLPPPKRKRKTPYDSEDDVPKGSRRMRDLRDIGSKTVPPTDIPHAGTISAPKYDDLPNVDQVKTSMLSPASAKRKHAAVHRDQPCGIPRKKDRSRPLSELCNGDIWNGSGSNDHNDNEHFLSVSTCSSSSSGTSTLDSSLDITSCHRHAAFKTDQAKGTETSCMTRLLTDDFRHGGDFVETPLAGRSTLEPDHLQKYQLCGLAKHPTWKHNKQANDCSKAVTCDRKNIKMRTISSVDQEVNNRTRDSDKHEHHKARTVKHKTPRDEVVLLEKRLDKRSLNKTSGADGKLHLAVIPTDLDCVGAVEQQGSKSKHDPEESSETISNRSNCDSGSVTSLVFELPLQVLPPQNKAWDLERCHAVKPIKTMHLNSVLYDVELSVLGSSNKGRRVPLVSLMSKWNRKPVVGYPVSVEVRDDVFDHPLSSRDDQHPVTGSVDGMILKRDETHPVTSSVDGMILKRDETEGLQCLVPPPPQACRAKPKNRSRKTSEKEVDKLWQPHTKKPASSSRKMRRLSSFASGQRDGDDRKSAVGKVSRATVACIPLRVVFSRINEALSFPVK